MATLYEELGVAPDASAAELRDAYRREARRRHPDLHPGREGEAEDSMRRLNAAWAILGNAESRRAYDASISHGFAPPADEVAAMAGDGAGDGFDGLPEMHGLRFRLWPLLLVVLLVIFVFTAYAAQGNRPAPSGPRVAANQCVSAIAGLDYVPCDQPNVGRLIQEVATDQPCPTGTFRHALVGGARVACVRRG